jgi:hypothetical protein
VPTLRAVRGALQEVVLVPLQLEADPRGSASCLPACLIYFRITVIERAVITFVSPS